jgi:hypothetical protein
LTENEANPETRRLRAWEDMFFVKFAYTGGPTKGPSKFDGLFSPRSVYVRDGQNYVLGAVRVADSGFGVHFSISSKGGAESHFISQTLIQP